MSRTPEPYPVLELDEKQRGLLRRYAQLFDTLARQVPPPDGKRYTAEEFVDWIELEERMRSKTQIGRRVSLGRQIGAESRQLRVATG